MYIYDWPFSSIVKTTIRVSGQFIGVKDSKSTEAGMPVKDEGVEGRIHVIAFRLHFS